MEELNGIEKEKYLQKIQLINNTDPYTLSSADMSTDLMDFPKIEYYDICNYLVYERRAYTCTEFKTYRNLEAYHQYASGCVKDVRAKNFPRASLITAKVRDSQGVASPWVIAEPSGIILVTHCNCAKGLEEICNHVAALLFSVDGITRAVVENMGTGMSHPASSADSFDDVEENLDFTVNAANIPPLDVHAFLAELAANNCICALHAVVEPFATELFGEKEPK